MSAPEYWKARAAEAEAKAGPNYPAKGDPWADFLHHRCRVLRMFRDAGQTPIQICATMRMDPMQVEMILGHVDEHPEEFE